MYRGRDPNDPTADWAVKRAKILTTEFQKEVRMGREGRGEARWRGLSGGRGGERERSH